MKYLLDTNVLSESVKTSPKKSVLAKLERHQHEITTASVVWHELLYGCYRLPKSKKRSFIERFLEELVYRNIPILTYDEQAAKWHASIRTLLISRGQTPPFADGQIAAIAKVNDLILVTNNTADFAYFEQLHLENWHE